jgi:hypothetical protein
MRHLRGVASAGVRMHDPRDTAVGSMDLGGRRVDRNAQDLVREA